MSNEAKGLWSPDTGEHAMREQDLLEWGRSGSFRPNLAFDNDSRMVLGGISRMLADFYSGFSAHKEEPHLTVFYVNPQKLYEAIQMQGILVNESKVYEVIIGVKEFCLAIPRVIAADLGASLVGLDVEALGDGSIVGVRLELSEALFHYILTIRALLVSRLRAIGVTDAVFEALGQDNEYRWLFAENYNPHVSLGSGKFEGTQKPQLGQLPLRFSVIKMDGDRTDKFPFL